MNLSDLLFDHPFADGEGLLHTVEETVTAGEARKAAQQTADLIAELGIGPGRAVAVQLPNGPDAVTTMAGVWRAGCVFVPINPRAPEQEARRLIGELDVSLLIGVDRQEVTGPGRAYDPGVGFVLWTSGTTGPPKPILHTHDGYLEILDRVLGQLRANPPEPGNRPSPNLIPVSLTLNSGIYNALFGLRAGAALVLMERFETGVFAELVRRFAIRSTVLPPAAIAMLNDDPSIGDLAPLRYVRSITAPLSPVEARRLSDRFGVFVLNGYGQSEIGEVIGWTARDARDHPEKLGAAGRPHPGVDIKVDADGRLWVRPPSRAAGYASGAELADRVDPDGYLDTGDLARIDPEGFVWIEGRAGDVINRGGNKIHPKEVEDLIRSFDGITDAAVVGADDPRLGQVPIAFYEGAEVPDHQLEALCRQHLVPYKVPVRFHRLEALPRNDAGKIMRNRLGEGSPG
jgi:acyl-coenzyme A synthetase/AMP-(fatty) acid ligase